MSGPIHLQPTAELAQRVLLPGDPGRALRLAEALLDRPRMFNHHRGLWGYTGMAPDGEPLTIQSTGMGGPSAAIVITELHALGARTAVRVGTCGALAPEIGLGALIIAAETIAEDGASRALGAPPRLGADPGLLRALTDAAPPGSVVGRVVCTDLFYDRRAGRAGHWQKQGAIGVEMESAVLYALAAQLGFRAAAILIAAGRFAPGGRRIDAEELLAAEQALGATALRAVG